MELPRPFTDAVRRLLGDEEACRLFAALEAEPSASIRLNPFKPLSPAPALPGEPVPWASSAYYLDRRPSFTFDPLFHAGCYYVQEASSMFLEQALRRYAGMEPLVALDLCAAPGGKSTHLRALLPQGSLLVSNEVVRSRAQVLAENMVKWGHPDVVVTNSLPEEFAPLKAFFDLVVTDVPCSGEGMFRKDPVAVSEWSTENVERCWQRQRDILTDIWYTLKPGGLLIYSTCTYNTHENEENVRWLCNELGALPLPLQVPPSWQVTGSLLPGDDMPVYRFLPHRTRGEGFFLAALRKPLSADGEQPARETAVRNASRHTSSRNRAKAPALSKEQQATVRGWLADEGRYVFEVSEGSVTAFPGIHQARLAALRASLRLLHAGVEVARQKGRDWLPSHALAMSTALRRDAFPAWEVDYDRAIAYLRKEAITLPADAPNGILLLTYRGIPLGFAKNLGNRANNLYPQEWRIRTTYLPDTDNAANVNILNGYQKKS